MRKKKFRPEFWLWLDSTSGRLPEEHETRFGEIKFWPQKFRKFRSASNEPLKEMKENSFRVHFHVATYVPHYHIHIFYVCEGQDEVVAVLANWYLLFVDLGLILNQGYK